MRSWRKAASIPSGDKCPQAATGGQRLLLAFRHGRARHTEEQRADVRRRHSDKGAGASLDMAKRCAHDAPRWDSWARFFDNLLKPKAMRGKSELTLRCMELKRHFPDLDTEDVQSLAKRNLKRHGTLTNEDDLRLDTARQ